MPGKHKDRINMIFPRFIFERKFEGMERFNQELFELAKTDAIANRTDGKDIRSVGNRATHLTHLRHNFMEDCQHPTVAQFIKMVDEAVRDYLRAIYNYDHQGELNMLSDPFYQSRAAGENVGISCHTHFPAHLVVTYYARTDRDPQETSPLRQGSVRFYDPQHINTRPWPNNNIGNVFTNAWFNLVPEEGSLLVFEGHIPHDSTFFDGEHRMCVPVMVDVITPKTQIKKPVSQLLAMQEGAA